MGDINENEGDTVEEEGADNTLMTTDITVNNQRGEFGGLPQTICAAATMSCFELPLRSEVSQRDG